MYLRVFTGYPCGRVGSLKNTHGYSGFGFGYRITTRGGRLSCPIGEDSDVMFIVKNIFPTTYTTLETFRFIPYHNNLRSY